VWAEAGVNFGALARHAAQRGLAGLEWAAGIPGTVGGAVVGNAGAHGSDMAGCLVVAEILHRQGQEHWPVERFAYGYRSSIIKRGAEEAIVLNATLRLERSTPQAVQERMDTYVAHRRRTQPPGASMGSMFKNPPGDYAGRLIEAAGLKGARIGEAEISRLHANFFVNLGQAKAADISQLIRLARREVAEKFGVELELEIEMVGDW
jgi:UDP-N-acetylmuramate dehydrogenase